MIGNFLCLEHSVAVLVVEIFIFTAAVGEFTSLHEMNEDNSVHFVVEEEVAEVEDRATFAECIRTVGFICVY